MAAWGTGVRSAGSPGNRAVRLRRAPASPPGGGEAGRREHPGRGWGECRGSAAGCRGGKESPTSRRPVKMLVSPRSTATRCCGRPRAPEYREKRREAPCKPGSVSPRGATAISLGPTSRPASNDLPGRHGAGRRREPSLFGLSPGGVCPADPVTRTAVRSCRTVSPLPRSVRTVAVSSLWHFPWSRDRLPLATTLTRGARTFLPALRRSGRPDASRRGLA